MLGLSSQPSRAKAVWQTCLASAFRTALACTIVGGATLYGPESLRRQVAYPAFSYVTVILIVTDATLGDTLRGCWHAVCATAQVVCPAILILWLIGPARFTTSTTALAVALSAFMVVLPGGTHLICKRIALGHIVITYVISFINGVHTEPVMHPVQVAASTATGALACVLALLFPYPSLAHYEVKKNCQLLANNISERLKLFMKAVCAEDKTSAQASISQAKSLAVTGTKLHRSIKCNQESMYWERLPVKFFRPCCTNPAERFQDIVTPLRGMEIALSSTPAFSVGLSDQKLREDVLRLEGHISKTLNQVYGSLPFGSSSVPESNAEITAKLLQTLQTTPLTHKDLSSLFFIYCLKLLVNKSSANLSSANSANQRQKNSSKNDGRFFKGTWDSLNLNISKGRYMTAFKFSLSLGFAVLFGLIYSKPDGYWSGLPVAISFASAREATFKGANVKAHGTVLGTVYGVLGCFVFEKLVLMRFISLFPWFIFTSLLRRSRMYGQAGGISAVIGAVLVLGRTNFGPPKDFAIARIVETFIGLSCSILMDILLQPTRASTLAKIQLSKCLETLHECVISIDLKASSAKANLVVRQKQLRFYVTELKKFIGEAEAEPDFWFLPFYSACYGKLSGSLSNVVDFLFFVSHAIGLVEQQLSKFGIEMVSKLEGDLKLFKDMVGFSIENLKEITLIKSLKVLDQELEKNNISYDPELEESPNSKLYSICEESDEKQIEKTENSYLQHAQEVVDEVLVGECEGELKSQVLLSFSAIAFCMSNIVKSTREMEREIKELVQWENPGSHVNLYAISCKIKALRN